MEGVAKDVPVPNDDPPAAAVYQLIVPVDAVALKVTDPVPHRELDVEPVIVGKVLIVAVTAVLVDVVHVPEVAST